MPPAAKSAVAADPALQDEVRAFAEGLGLQPGSGNAGFDDSDFAPSKAKQRIHADSSAAPAISPAKSKNKFKPENAGEVSAAPEPAESQRGATGIEPGSTREWQTGAGERPGGKSAKALLDAQTPWHEASAALPPLSHSSSTAAADDALVEAKSRVAEKLLESEAAAFERQLSKRNPADAQWLQSVRKMGTARDKVAANVLVVQEDPVANLRALDELIGSISKPGGAREIVGHTVEALAELCTTALLPDRPLVAFAERPIAAIAQPSKENDRRLLLWWAEDCIKRRYAILVSALERASVDNLDWIKEKALKAAYELLANKPEAEAKLLNLLVNKLGDPNRKVASKAGYLLSCLLTKHPLMGMVVVREIESFLFRPQQKSRARYYAVVTLNQMVLSHNPNHGGSALAVKLIDIYFSLFRLTLDRKIGVAAERDAAAGDGDMADGAKPKKRSTGVRKGGRASRKGGKHQQKHRHKPKQNAPAAPGAEEVDARMLTALLTGVRRAHPYVAAGALEGVFAEHAPQLFRTVHAAPFTVATQALMLLFQVMDTQGAVSDRFYGALYHALLHGELTRSSAMPQFLGILFQAVQAVKADVSTKRAAAFVKRLLQVALQAPPHVAAGALLLSSELLKAKPALWPMLTQPEDAAAVDAGVDAPEASDAESNDGEAPTRTKRNAAPPQQGQWEAAQWPGEGAYDLHKRAPQHAHAERSCLWEAAMLARHAHPSAAVFAKTLLSGANVAYDGDPLKDLALLPFLDKFVKRKAGKGTDKHMADKGGSVMQPVAAADPALPASAATSSATPTSAAASPPAASDALAALAQQNIAPEDVFFHKFVTLDSVRQRAVANRAKRKGRAAAKAKAHASGEGVVPDDSSSGDEDGEGDAGDSDAEDAFLDAAEHLEGDALGDPSIGFTEDELMNSAAEFDDAGDDASDGGDDRDEDSDMSGAEDDPDSDGESADDSADEDLDEATQNHSKRAAQAPAASQAAWDIADDELDGVNIFELPSPNASSELGDAEGASDDSADAAHGGVHVARASSARAPPRSAGTLGTDSDSDIDDAALERALMGGSEDSEDGTAELVGGPDSDGPDSDDADSPLGSGSTSPRMPGTGTAGEPADLPDGKPLPKRKCGSKADAVQMAGGAARQKRKGASLFAAAEDYAEMLASSEQQGAGEEHEQVGDKRRHRKRQKPLKKSRQHSMAET